MNGSKPNPVFSRPTFGIMRTITFFPGPQDIAWDVAAVVTEFRFNPAEGRRFYRSIRARVGRFPHPAANAVLPDCVCVFSHGVQLDGRWRGPGTFSELSALLRIIFETPPSGAES